MPHILFRVLAGTTGVLVFYTGFFMYEDSEGRLQNRLEEFSKKIRQKEIETGRRFTAALNQIAEFANRWLDHLFGKKLLSFEAFGSSMLYSFAGFVALIAIVSVTFITTESWLFLLPLILSLIFALVLFVVLPHIPRSSGLGIAFAIGLAVMLLGLFALTIAAHGSELGVLFLGIAFVCSFVTDIVQIASVRFTIRSISTTSSVFVALLGIVLQLAFTAGAAGGPILVALRGKRDDLILGSSILAAFNFSTMLLSLSFSLILLAIILHRLSWPTLSHLIYPLARFSVLRNRKLMAAIGVGCITYALPAAGWIHKVIELFK